MELMSGNEAIAQGAWEAGARIGVAYPGTPSTETLEAFAKMDGVYAEWCVNEKVAVEVGVGASAAGARVLSTMKHVGVNVAADPLFTAAYTGVGGGMVVLAADDPGMYSSQNEQDSHWYAQRGAHPHARSRRLRPRRCASRARPTSFPSASTCRSSSAPRCACRTRRPRWSRGPRAEAPLSPTRRTRRSGS